jgi:hypothetical protein
MAIRIIADAMTLEIENHVVATTRVGEHAAADGKWGMDQVGRGANVCSNPVLWLVQRAPRSQ